VRRFALVGAWLFGSAITGIIGWAAFANVSILFGGIDTYDVVSNGHYDLSLCAAFGLFTGLYLVFELTPVIRYRRSLGWAHLLLMAIGVLLICFPILAARSNQLRPKFHDAAANFGAFSTFQSVGYALTLISLAVFAVLVIEGWAASRRRRP
jgi:cytochrome c oxidase subunit I